MTTEKRDDAPKYRTLSVCMPVYNEENTISEVVGKILAADISMEIKLVVTDDASFDGTSDILERLQNENPGRMAVTRHEKNLGKGASIADCLDRADGDVIIIQDADLEYSPDDYPAVLDPILNDDADVVYGARFTGGRPEGTPMSRYLGNRALTIEFNLLHGTKLNDMETCYKAFRKEVVSSIDIRSARFGMEPEITAKIVRAGYTIKEVPVSYSARAYSEGKKITVWDGVKAVGAIAWFRFFD